MKTLSILILSLFVVACAGKPPVMERKIKLYNGQPNLRAMCRTSTPQAVAFARHSLKTHVSVDQVMKVLRAALKADAQECINADTPEFAGMAGMTFEDLGVLLRFQEDLLFSCAKWKQ